MRARYIRVSTANQNYERQLKKIHCDEKLYIDVCSGSIPFTKREQGKQLIENKDVTYLCVNAIDRLGRNLLDILTTLKEFDERGVTVKIDNLGLESRVNNKPNQAFKLIISVMGNIAEMERETMLERQKEGIAIAKAKGIYKGRERGSKESKEDFLKKHKEVVKFLKQEKYSIRDIARLTNVSTATVQKVKKCLV